MCVSLNIKCKPLETYGRHLCDVKIPFCLVFFVFLGPGDETDELKKTREYIGSIQRAGIAFFFQKNKKEMYYINVYRVQ